MKLKKDEVIKLRGRPRDEEDLMFIYNDEFRWMTINSIKDENGERLSWYYHDVYKKISHFYWDKEQKVAWLPKEKLYNKTKCKRFYKNVDLDKLAFFNVGYFKKLIGMEAKPEENGMSGLFAKGAGSGNRR